VNLPGGTRGRIVAWALVLLPAILAYEYGLAPLIDWYRDRQAEIADSQDAIQRYRAALAQLPALESAVARLDDEQPLAALLIEGANSALSAARLQRLLQTTARDKAVEIVSLRVRQAELHPPLEEVAVEARLRTDTGGLRDLLYALDIHRPYVFIDSIRINARPPRRRGQQDEDVLDVQLVVTGLRIPVTPSQSG
jgi:hypothetical protein